MERDQKSINFQRYFSKSGVDPFSIGWDGSRLEYELRSAKVNDDRGNVVFAQDDVEVPTIWTPHPTNTVASKYFYGKKNSSEREHSIKQVFGRVADFIGSRGSEMGYFASEEDAKAFSDELKVLMINQAGMFNSPVLFNCGLFDKYGIRSGSIGNYYYDTKSGSVLPIKDGEAYVHPQGSACFITNIEDSMHSIMKDGAYNYAMLFKHGSGVGSDLSNLRSSRELLTGGGQPSGPLSFMKIFDAVADVVKSGGKTRRAAIMESLKVSHPDIMDFITAKSSEEKKAWALIEQGYDGSFGGEAYSSVKFQNMNLSVRVSDEFMRAAKEGRMWRTSPILNKELADKMPEWPAQQILRTIAESTHICGDPGTQYETTINRWHTCKKSGPINASNPCSEYMFVDNSACNLASLNLRKFLDEKGILNIDSLKKAVRTFIIAQEILVDSGGYPSDKITQNTHDFRPLGLGYANLGAAVMSLGMPYDSDQARTFASAVTDLITATAYATSSELAKARGAFSRFDENKDSMLEVIAMHKTEDSKLDPKSLGSNEEIVNQARQIWQENIENGDRYGFRNAQVTLLAPTGTIGFVMDCDTTGVEPDIALVKYKELVGKGFMRIVNKTIRKALETRGYDTPSIENIIKYVDEKDTIAGAPGLKNEDLPIFDCAMEPKGGGRSISYQAHLKMMAAVQPFLSGAISKTINMPKNSTVEDIVAAYQMGHELGLKAVAIYRDGSKKTQPVSTSRGGEGKLESTVKKEELTWGKRRKLPANHESRTHKFSIGGHDGYYHVGFYNDGKIGQLWIDVSKDGTTLGTGMRLFATAFSFILQLGMPLEEATRKFEGYSFEPSGIITGNEDIHFAKSMVDYIMKDVKIRYVIGKKSNSTIQTSTAEESPTKTNESYEVDTEEKLGKLFEEFIKGKTLTDKTCPACNKWKMIALDNKGCHMACLCGHESTEGCGK